MDHRHDFLSFHPCQFSKSCSLEEQDQRKACELSSRPLAVRKGWERPLNEDGTPDLQKWLDLSDDIRLSLAEQRKIDSRAERISDRHAASTGLQHLRSDDMKKLDVLRHGVRLAHSCRSERAAVHRPFCASNAPLAEHTDLLRVGPLSRNVTNTASL
jgi:hypothetical protein